MKKSAIRIYPIIIFVSIIFIIQSCSNISKDGTVVYTVSKVENANEKPDQTPILLRLLESIDKKRPAKIVFEKGIYHFYPNKAFGKYHEITNHDNGYYRIVFPLIDFDNIEIDAQGSEFIFHGQIIPFLVQESNNVNIKNVVVDWEIPHYVQAKIIANNQSASTIDVEFSDTTVLKQDGNRLTFGAEGWSHNFLGDNIIFDSEKKSPIYNTNTYFIHYNDFKNIISEKLSPSVYRLKAKFISQVPPVNSIITFKGAKRNRTSPAFHLINSKNIVLEDVTIHHAGGMGVIGEKTENITLNHINVVRRDGSERIVTTTADATHFCNCKGRLTIQNCIFENMLDDATNVHGTYLRVENIIDKKTLHASINHFQQFGYDFATESDTLRFVNDSTQLPIDVPNIVSKIKKINERYYEIQFRNDLPTGLKANDGIENITWYPVTTIENNIVRNNRARGFLISSGKPVVIRKNRITSQMSAILIEGDLNHWFESGAVNNVMITENEFIDCAYSGYKQPVIYINPMMKKHVLEKYEKDIYIENNSFKSFDTYIIDAKSVDGLFIRNNIIELTTTYPPLWNPKDKFTITECKNVNIVENKY